MLGLLHIAGYTLKKKEAFPFSKEACFAETEIFFCPSLHMQSSHYYPFNIYSITDFKNNLL